MPAQRKDQSIRSTSVNVDRVLYEEVISRGYSFSEIVNMALAAVLQADDEMIIRYDALTKMRTTMAAKARAERLTIAEEKRGEEEKQQEEDAELIDALCADYLKQPKVIQDYTKRKFEDGEQHYAFLAFAEKTGKSDLSKRSEIAFYAVVECNGQRVKALPLFKSKMKKLA